MVKVKLFSLQEDIITELPAIPRVGELFEATNRNTYVITGVSYMENDEYVWISMELI